MSRLPDNLELMEEILLTNELVWEGKINQTMIDEWLSNFVGDVFDVDYERSIALWLLANFVYYNLNEVSHLFKVAYGDLVRKIVTRISGKGLEKALEETLQKTVFGTLGKTSESSSMLLYYFRTVNAIGMKNFLPTKSVDYESVVFVDDVTLSTHTGSQAWGYLRAEMGKHHGKEIHVLTMLASRAAIDFLEAKGIIVTSAICLDDENKAFSKESYVFHSHEDHKARAEKMAIHYGQKCFPKSPLGHGDGQYLFGFWYNVPDNSLPIFWSDQNGWTPIFRRSHKVYGLTEADGIGTFI